jgi:hypothetical protein
MDNIREQEPTKAELIRKLYTDPRSKSSWLGLNHFLATSKYKDPAEVKAALQGLDAYNVNQKVTKKHPTRMYKVHFQSFQAAIGKFSSV